MKRHPVAICLVGLLLMGGGVKADEVVRSSGNGPLNLTTAWVGGVVPSSNDTAVWSSSSSHGTTTLGGDLSWFGMRITDLSAASYAIGTGSSLTLGAGGIDLSVSTANLNYAAGIILGADQTWNIASDRSIELASGYAVSGTGQLTFAGGGTTVIRTAAFTNTGGTVLDSSRLSIGATPMAFGTGDLTIKGNAFMDTYSAASRTISSPITFEGASNTLTLGTQAIRSQFVFTGNVDTGTEQRTISLINTTAPSTSNLALRFEGGTITATNGGSLIIANGNDDPSTQGVLIQLGNNATATIVGDFTIGSGVHAYLRNDVRLDAKNADLTVDGKFDLSNLGTVAASQTIKSLSGSGEILSSKTSAGTSTLTIDGQTSASTTTFSGSITNGLALGTVALTKTGSNTQILSGNNTYTGATAINAGTLLINGNQSSATGNVTVALGATLGGTGTVGGSTTVNGTLAAGMSPGTLTFSQGLNLNDGSTYAFEGGDLVIVNGQLDLNDNWTLALGSGFADGGSTVIFSYGSLAASPDLTPTFDITGLGFTPTGPLSLTNDTINNQIVLVGVSVIPEPGTSLLVGLGLAGLLYGFRRRA